MTKQQLAAFVTSYLQTAAWAENESITDCDLFTRNGNKIATEDCERFIGLCKEVGIDPFTYKGVDLDYPAPHDLYLTRNGHGAGFWDKEDLYGEENAAKLTEIAKQMGEKTAYHVRGPKSKLTF